MKITITKVSDGAFGLSQRRRRRLAKQAQLATDAILRTQYPKVLHRAGSQQQPINAVGASISSVKRVRMLGLPGGAAGLVDRPKAIGPLSEADDGYAADMVVVLRSTPHEHGQRRPA